MATVNLPNIKSAAFWSAIGGAASTILGALGYAHEGSAVNSLLIALGTVMIGLPAHHVIGKQQGTLPTAAPSPAPAPIPASPIS